MSKSALPPSIPSAGGASRTGLLVIDMQVALYNGPVPPFRGEAVLSAINRLIAKARAAEAPIFAVQHTGPIGSPVERGSAGWALIPELEIDPRADTLVDKQAPSCFTGTLLHSWLQAQSVDTLVVTGMKTQYCIDTACRAASALGYQVILAADAHTCMDTEALPAEKIIAHHNVTLAGPFVRLEAAESIAFR
ncbi:nicotinamidase-related amidase [Pseudomonas duriflava]|uniref:Nicotinamidase-related amidase n=1 Tax=Pseudomonas duriflava TaxID=459528 RepID=A0A562QK22_9PSED|nr:cysteine hydrolase family protein [Pseudomonas duriflava]TWI56540.1 nicotinamidase-related amidase [Pseudomonas duriflava]